MKFCRVYSQRNMVSPDNVVTLSLTRTLLRRHECKSFISKWQWSVICYAHINGYLWVFDIIRYLVGDGANFLAIVYDGRPTHSMILLNYWQYYHHTTVDNKSQCQCPLSSWKAISCVFFPTFPSCHLNP